MREREGREETYKGRQQSQTSLGQAIESSAVYEKFYTKSKLKDRGRDS